MGPQSDTGASRNSAIGLTFAVVLTSGVVGWTALYAGLGRWGLLLGLVLLAASLAWLIRRHPSHAAFVAGFGFAFFLLTWPVLWLVVGYIWYLVTGEPIESD